MRDEIIEEIRERRKKMVQDEFGGSMKRFGEIARQWQTEHPQRVVNLRKIKKAALDARQG